MKRIPTGPRLARRLLERALPADAREDIAGDLEEVFRRRCDSNGVGRARLWYWREAISFAGRLLCERLLERSRSIRVLLLVVACVNVATLVFARTATRENEIAVRRALGASRGRVVMQLFVEALVLASLAALIGLVAADRGLRWVLGTGMGVEGLDLANLFWWDDSLAPATVVYVAILTALGAIIVGVVPALKVT